MRHAKSPPAKYSNRRSTIWFDQADGKSFSREHIRDASNYYSRAGEVGTMPFGAFVHTRLPWTRHANPLEALHAIILLNRASAGFVIPTSHLDTEWKFEELAGPEVRITREHLQAISLLVALRIQHTLRQLRFFGAAQPLFSLEHGEGTCFERASVLAAVYRVNGIPSRIVGNPDFFPVEVPTQRQHWWVEAFASGEWHPLDPNFHPGLPSLLIQTVLLAHSDTSDFEGLLGVLDLLSASDHVWLTDDPYFRDKVRSRVVTPEIEMPRQYASVTDVRF